MNRTPLRLGLLALLAVSAIGCNKNTASVQDAAAIEPPRETLLIPDGTCVVATLDRPLATGTNQTGDPFILTTVEPILIDGETAYFPVGTAISGVLQDVQASGPAPGRARMTLSYLWITDAEGGVHAIAAEPLAMRAEGATGADVEPIAGTSKDAALGAGASVGAGDFVVLATGGDEIELEAGQKINVMMTASTIIHVLAQE